MRYLILLLIVMPALEIGLLLYSGKVLGVLPTVFLIIFTGVLGAYLAKKQGLDILNQAKKELQYGRVPSEAIIDGLFVLVGGTVLLTPGFITDTLGFLFLFPYTRRWFKPLVYRLFRKWIDKGNIIILR
ncbi:FxsA family protein [Aeribacillus pallidus]|jgi:UPF0716 protein FxsA|uniref:FxsA family protein n=1 Tax=Aeribacillus pallidus TaxID=33936 RepID=UPI001E18F39E|nr:membrane protein FxsA [Bacillus sp. (in: firmicutes)]